MSVHLPKTAGTSFAAALKNSFGSTLIRDYPRHLKKVSPNDKGKLTLQDYDSYAAKDFEGIECIHGHFNPCKYLPLSEKRKVTFVTWMRNPVERILSHYYYWTKKTDPRDPSKKRQKVLEEQWSIERFCLGPEYRNVYSKYLNGFSLERFSFIGITEFYDEDFSYFLGKYTTSSLEPERRNVSARSAKDYEISESLKRDIAQHHSKDMDLYQQALETRIRRCQN